MANNNHFLIPAMLSLVSCGSAWAYDSSDDAKVTQQRQQSAYTQKGIKAGSFNILPDMDMTNEYSSNIYYSDKTLGSTRPVVDSYVAHYKPGLMVRSDWGRNALNLTFDSDISQYASQPDQNDYQDLRTKLDGKLDVLRDSYLTGAFAYNSLHESRGSPDQINGKGPTFYNTKVMDAFYNHKFNRLNVVAGGNATRFDYQNVQTLLTGAPLIMSSRDHWEYTPSLRFGYEIQKEYEAFVKFTYKQANYDTMTLTNGAGTAYNRNSTGYNVVGGMAFDLTDLLTGDMSVGYLQRTYTDVRFQTISGINGFLNLKWRPTALTTVNGKVSRDINETTQAGVAGIFATGLLFGVEHELLRNVILKGGGNYTKNDYNGFVAPSVENRVDNIYGGTVAAKYLFNRNFSTDLGYTYQNRDTNYAYSNYQVHQVMLNLRGQF